YSLPQRCEFLVAELKIFERKCIANFPVIANNKFRDTFIQAGEPYALYMPKSLDQVMVLMKKSTLQECSRFQVRDVNVFQCLDNNGNDTILLDKTAIYCFPFHIQLPDELMSECVEQQFSSEGDLKDVLQAKVGIIHYTFCPSRAARLSSGPVKLMLLLLWLWLWVCLWLHRQLPELL
ncbi:hypothetical protein KR018_007462, partial [Drosophila ironensis]